MKLIGSKISRLVTKYPSILTLGIVAGITLALGTAIGMLDHQQVLAASKGVNVQIWNDIAKGGSGTGGNGVSEHHSSSSTHHHSWN